MPLNFGNALSFKVLPGAKLQQKKKKLEFFPMIPISYPPGIMGFFKQVKCCWSNHFAFQQAPSFVVDDEKFCLVRCPQIH